MANTMKSCMTAAKEDPDDASTTPAAKKACTDNAKKAIMKSLGKETMTDTDFNAFQEETAEKAAFEAMEACMEAANGVTSEQKKCKAEAKKTMAAALGKDPAEINATEMEEKVKKGAARGVANAMKACIDTIDTTLDAAAKKVARKACRTDKAKEALAKGLGKDASTMKQMDVIRYLKRAAADAFESTMDACVQTAGDDKAKLEKCAKETAKDALKDSLGKASVTDSEVNEYKAKAGRKAVKKKMQACVKAAGTDKAKKKACRKSSDVRKGLASSLGKPESEVDDTDLQKYIQDAGRNAVREAMSACMETIDTTLDAAAKKAARKACKTGNAKSEIVLLIAFLFRHVFQHVVVPVVGGTESLQV